MEELDGPAVSGLRRAIAEVKQATLVGHWMGDQTFLIWNSSVSVSVSTHLIAVYLKNECCYFICLLLQPWKKERGAIMFNSSQDQSTEVCT
jgi:hypothetical protein